eukprot:3007584-Rhodomonas_salina.1
MCVAGAGVCSPDRRARADAPRWLSHFLSLHALGRFRPFPPPALFSLSPFSFLVETELLPPGPDTTFQQQVCLSICAVPPFVSAAAAAAVSVCSEQQQQRQPSGVSHTLA